MEERLQKLLARAGLASRRAAEQLIAAGRVTVNGRTVSELGAKADPRRDDVRLDGEPVRASRARVLLLHKPVGVVTTLADPDGRPTIRDYLPAGHERVFPVGRLDFHSSGLLLLTNDGELAARLLHPRWRIARTYRVKVSGRPSEAALGRLRRGVKLDDGVSGPAQVDVERLLPAKAWLRITVREGRRREIRRMCDAVGHPVERLVRVRFGPIELGRLPPGRWRALGDAETAALRAAVGLGARGAGAGGSGETKRSRASGLTSRAAADSHPRSSRKPAAMRGVEQSGSSRGS
ncbi:MAG: rRNA pseudouridine synthase [Deltaproteobacteria bacterium]|nr:rRNA pseudouridine synthase [Deltaproteobacteria bacterium]